VIISIICIDCNAGVSPESVSVRCERCEGEWVSSSARAEEALTAVWMVRSQFMVSDETHAALELVRLALNSPKEVP
jgi:hypothetical protein